MRKKKFGWTAFGIVGMIFTPMGLFFAAIGLVVGLSGLGEWKNPGDPTIFLAVFCGIGGLFLLMGLIFLGLDLRRRRRLRIAWESGNCVEAEFLGVVTRHDVNTVHGQPRVVECAWTSPDGVVHVYRSRYLYIDVTRLLKDKKIPVYIDRYDESIGFVDIDAVLPEIRIHI